MAAVTICSDFSRYLAAFHGSPVRTFSVKKSLSCGSQPNDTNGSLGACSQDCCVGLGYSLGVSQSAQEMPGLRTIDFISYIGQLVLVVKNPPANAGDVRDPGSIPGSGISPGEGNGNPLQYSCLGNPMDRGTW